jgi:hypothetical protein
MPTYQELLDLAQAEADALADHMLATDGKILELDVEDTYYL